MLDSGISSSEVGLALESGTIDKFAGPHCIGSRLLGMHDISRAPIDKQVCVKQGHTSHLAEYLVYVINDSFIMRIVNQSLTFKHFYASRINSLPHRMGRSILRNQKRFLQRNLMCRLKILWLSECLHRLKGPP
jgi:hypothetical protein